MQSQTGKLLVMTTCIIVSWEKHLRKFPWHFKQEVKLLFWSRCTSVRENAAHRAPRCRVDSRAGKRSTSSGGLLPPAACRHLHCNSAVFLSMKPEPANWLRKVFSYETHSGEVSETSSQCSKLNPVPLGKSAKTILSLRNYVQGPNCARGGCTTCQTASQTDSDGHVKTQRREKDFLFPFFFYNSAVFYLTHYLIWKDSAWPVSSLHCLIMWSTWKKGGKKKRRSPYNMWPPGARSDF